MYQNYCNETILVPVIVEDVVACFFPRHSVYILYGVNDGIDRETLQTDTCRPNKQTSVGLHWRSGYVQC